MATIDVSSFEQIATILSQLATNYSNIFADYYNLFYNPVPMDITVQIYDDGGNLNSIVIPNRAKDREYILNGNGDPNNAVSAPKGSIYQDLTSGSAYIKQFANTDNTGWSEFMTLESLEDYLMQGAGDPEGIVSASKGILYVDRTNATLYLKSTATGNTGWILISANTTNLANRDLSNLSEMGEAHFANSSLSNLSEAGTNLINSKENISNKVTLLSSESTNEEYPSAKIVYDSIQGVMENSANKDLSNLNEEGENHFVGLNQVRDCIFSAPEGLPSYNNNVISLSMGTTLLCTDGVDNNLRVKNIKVTTVDFLSTSVSWTGANTGVVFYNRSEGNLIYYSESSYFRQPSQPSGYSSMIWYNPNTNLYRITSNSGNSWTTISAAEIGRFSTNSSGSISKFYPYHPLKSAMEDDIESLNRKLSDNVSVINSSLSNKANTSLNNCVTGAFENLIGTAQSTGKGYVTNWGMPNYSAAVTKDWATSYLAETSGYVILQTGRIDDKGDHVITVTHGGVSLSFASAGATSASEWFRYNLLVPIPQGASWIASGDSYSVTLYWIPCIGG